MSEKSFMLNFEIRDACERKLRLTFDAKQDVACLLSSDGHRKSHFRKVSKQHVRKITSTEAL